MRAQIDIKEIKNFFETVYKKSRLNLESLGTKVDIHSRTLRDWRRGKYTPKVEVLQKISLLSGVPMPKINKYLNDYWHAPIAARLGRQAVTKKYGHIFIAPEVRKIAAYKAMATRIASGDTFYSAKQITYPTYSESLAEFIGIVLGDGSITKNQVTITLHKNDDAEFVLYVVKLIHSLFDVAPSVAEREMVKNIVVSRKKLVMFLQDAGLVIGNKVYQQVDVPKWIKQNIKFSIACARGLFDTDGCIYVDKHTYKDKIYRHCGLTFRNYSFPLLNFFKNILRQHLLNPTQGNLTSVTLRKGEEIKKYFKIIGSSNPKHLNKFQKFHSKTER